MIGSSGGGSSPGIGFGANGGINVDILNAAGFFQLVAAEGPAGTDGAQPFQSGAGIYQVPSGKTLKAYILHSSSGTAGLRFGLAYSNNSIARNSASVPATAVYESGTNGIYLHRTVAGTQWESIIFSFPALSYPCYQAALTTAMSVSIFCREE